jgi:hypothetical protein
LQRFPHLETVAHERALAFPFAEVARQTVSVESAAKGSASACAARANSKLGNAAKHKFRAFSSRGNLENPFEDLVRGTQISTR